MPDALHASLMVRLPRTAMITRSCFTVRARAGRALPFSLFPKLLPVVTWHLLVRLHEGNGAYIRRSLRMFRPLPLPSMASFAAAVFEAHDLVLYNTILTREKNY